MLKRIKAEPRVCAKGHQFFKSSDCPVCPICWPGQRKKLESDFPKLPAPALRALNYAGIKNMEELSFKTEAEVLEMHGLGKKSLSILIKALKIRGLSFRES